MTFTPIYHTQRATKGYDLSVMRTPEGNLSLAIAYFHNGGSAITLTRAEEDALMRALYPDRGAFTGQPNPGASIPAAFPEPPLPDSQLANDGACT